MKKLLSIVVICLVFCWINGQSQPVVRKITGTTRDSVSLEVLSFVYIRVIPGDNMTVSDEAGKFTITGNPGDSLEFTRLGYKSKKIIVLNTTGPMIISLKENSYLLNTVTIYGNLKPAGEQEWKKSILPKSFKNPAQAGSGHTIETFGPGYVFHSPLSHFSKGEKEKRKVQKMRTESAKTSAYRNTVHSPEIKAYLQKQFALTEDEYYKTIEQFNRQYPDIANLKNEKDIMEMLVYFFSKKK